MRRRKASVPVLIVIAALIVYAVVSLVRMKGKLTEAVRTEQELRTQVTELEKENAELQYAVEHADDPDVIAGVARDKLGLVDADDRVFIDPDGN